MGKKIDFRAQHYQKYRLYKEKLEQKLLRIQFPTKNSVGAHVYLSLEWSKRAWKIAMFEIA